MTYLYETIPGTEGEAIHRYEIQQSIHDGPLTHHPDTGAPIRRVITGGIGFITGKPQSSPHGCGCGHGGCGHC